MLGIDNNVPIFEVKFPAPVFMGDGNLLYPLAKGSNTVQSHIKFKNSSTSPSKHSSVDFAVEVIRKTVKNNGIIKLIFFKFCIMAIYIFLLYNLYKI